MPSPDLKHRVLHAIGWSSVAKLSAQMINWVVTLIVITKLSPEDYGLMAIASAIIGAFITLSAVGLGDGLKQVAQLNDTVLRQVFAINLVATALFLALIAAAAYPLALLYEETRLVPIILAISLNLVFIGMYMIPRALLERKLELKRAMVVEVSASVMSSLTTLIMALSGFGVWSLVAGYLVANLCNMIGYNIIEPFLKLPQFKYSEDTKRITNFGFLRTLEQIAWYLYASADVFIIGKLVGPTALGFYSVAKTLAQLPLSKSAPILNIVAFSAFSLAKREEAHVGEYFIKAVRVLSLISFPVFFGLSAIAPQLVDYILGDKWTEAILPMQIIAVASAFMMIGLIVGPYLQGTGHVQHSLRNALFGLILFPTLITIGCFWGLIGAALAWSIAQPIFFLQNMRRAARVTGIAMTDVFGAMAVPCLTAALMYGVVRLTEFVLPLDTPEILVLAVSITAGAATYFLGLAVLQRNAYSEVRSLFRRGA